jgi:small-conductance mechanosensitive channel
MKKAVAYILLILAGIMLFLSFQIQALPPGITGLGFIGIALVFLKESSS